MTKEICTVKENDDLECCTQLMSQKQIRRLPVVDEELNCIGLISQAHIARYASIQKAGELAKDISNSHTAEKSTTQNVTNQTKSNLIFVVHKHAARHLHYDFRLEINGVLKSWAIPKGPSLDPTQKRLALHVEDHPLHYSTFEGVIPAEEYGGGTVLLWDRGAYEPINDLNKSYSQGKLQFVLHGKKLKGKWTLIKIKTKQKGESAWLLIKEKDDEAKASDTYDILIKKPLSVVSKLDLQDISEKYAKKIEKKTDENG